VRSGSDAGTRVTVVAPSSDRNAETGAVWLAVIVLSLVAVAVAVGLALVQGRRLARPLERLARQAGGIGGRAPARAGASGIEEVDRVSDALADAGRRVADALRREREFSANASHQLRSPLTALRMRLEVLADTATGETREEATAALAQADRLMATIEQLERLAAGDRDGAPTTDLALLATKHAAVTWAARFAGHGRALTVAPHHGVAARMAPETARQVLDVLLDNALHHGDGPVRIELSQDERWARLAVQDGGPGVPEGDAERAFARRWSGAGGSGIGLALARDLVREAGGDLSLAAAGGARFEAVVPAGSAIDARAVEVGADVLPGDLVRRPPE
jgi:signal transduction histidine kinase